MGRRKITRFDVAPIASLVLLMSLTLSACGQSSAKVKSTPTPPPPKGWNAVASPRVGEEGNLKDVTIISANDAWAVGDYHGLDALQRTLAEHWDGNAWSVVDSPNPSQVSNEFDAVSGTSTSDVWAVGMVSSVNGSYFTPSSLIEHWNGKTWSVSTLPALGQQENHLTGIAAISPTDAWAVGYTSAYGPNITTATTPLSLHWDGTSWKTISSAPTATGEGVDVMFSAVTAVSSNDVWAVGQNRAAPLIEHWNGSAWTVAQGDPSTQAVLPGNGGLTSVSADGPNDIWAVGSGALGFRGVGGCGNGAFHIIEHWDGQSWSDVSFPAPATGYQNRLFSFNHVSAAASNDVWAVGGVTTGEVGNITTISPVAEHWDGSQWTISPQSFSPMTDGFAGVAAKDGMAWTVGQAEISNDGGATVVGQWNGSQWALVGSPSPGTQTNSLNGIAAFGSKDVWAVGDSAGGTLSEHWDGAHWSVVPTVNIAKADNHLNAVAGSSAKDVWAVGSGGGTYFGQGAILHWDGSAWRSVPVATIDGKPSAALYGVASLSPTDAWAVGRDGAQHWDGATWSASVGSRVTLAYGGIGMLFGVAAVKTNDVWAVGGQPGLSCGGMEPALIAHWDGKQWSTMPNMPNGVLQSISAVSSNDVWAVGGALFMHWDGTKWTQTTFTNAQWKQFGSPRSVFARASNDVWVVCEAYGSQQTAILHWDGHSWTPTTIKRLGQYENTLDAVVAVSPSEVWAVGKYSQSGDADQALIERYIK